MYKIYVLLTYLFPTFVSVGTIETNSLRIIWVVLWSNDKTPESVPEAAQQCQDILQKVKFREMKRD